MAYIDFTDATGRVHLKAAYPIPGDRFANWTPQSRPFGDVSSRLSDGALSMFTYRTDHGASFDVPGIPTKVIRPPTGVAAVSSTLGGTLAAATYYYVVTAIGPGESTKSLEVSATTTGATSKVTLTWTDDIPGITAYRVYRGTSAGAESVVLSFAGGGGYVDTGTAGTAATPPTNGVSGVAVANRLVAWLLQGGTCGVFTQDTLSSSYSTCSLAPGTTPMLRLANRQTLEYTLSLQLLNTAGSPVAMLVQYV